MCKSLILFACIYIPHIIADYSRICKHLWGGADRALDDKSYVHGHDEYVILCVAESGSVEVDLISIGTTDDYDPYQARAPYDMFYYDPHDPPMVPWSDGPEIIYLLFDVVDEKYTNKYRKNGEPFSVVEFHKIFAAKIGIEEIQINHKNEIDQFEAPPYLQIKTFLEPEYSFKLNVKYSI